MDFVTARHFLIEQALPEAKAQAAFINALRRGAPPEPGQVTSILLALKTVTRTLAQEPAVDRPLGYALFMLAYESRQLYSRGERAGIDWPPLLDQDLLRIAEAVRGIWAEPA